MKKKILLLGDTANAIYHPVDSIQMAIKDILIDKAEVTTIMDQSWLLVNLFEYDVVISYLDRWNEVISDKEALLLETYVSKGGSLLVLHNGISIARNKILGTMIGAEFIEHPKACVLDFYLDQKHAISKGLSNYQAFEEPYQYDLLPEFRKEVFLSYGYEGNQFEAGWTSSYNKGNIVCLHPGHDASAFEQDVYRLVLRRSVDWLCMKQNTVPLKSNEKN